MPRVEIIRRRRLLDDFLSVDEAVVRHQRTDGSMSRPLRRLSVERGDGAAALVSRRDTGTVVLVRQFRYPAYAHGTAWLLEVVAGMVDAGEDPAACIRREIAEETGYQVLHLQSIGTYYLSPGGSSERIFLFHAEVDGSRRPGRGGGVGTEDEDIEVVELDLQAALELLAGAAIQDAKTVIALQWLRFQGGRRGW